VVAVVVEVVGAVEGVVPFDVAVEQAVCASPRADSAVASSVSVVCWAATTACCAWARLDVEPLGPVPEGVVVDVVVVVDGAALVVGEELALEGVVEDEGVEEESVDDWADSSSVSLASAAESLVWAEETSISRVVVSNEASASPAVTCWFKETSTVDTVPATWNSAVAWWTADAFPETSRVLRTVAVVDVPVR
jgi:hypothetical protein